MSNKPEVWLRGPLNNVPPLVQPVAHALIQAKEEVNQLMDGFPEELLWQKPAGLASPGFHLQYLAGVLDRLFTYSRSEQLSRQQLDTLATKGKPNGKAVTMTLLLAGFNKQVDDALIQLSTTDEVVLTEKREVGRTKLPSSVIGLYIHAAEHTMRHVGQLLVTVNVLKKE